MPGGPRRSRPRGRRTRRPDGQRSLASGCAGTCTDTSWSTPRSSPFARPSCGPMAGRNRRAASSTRCARSSDDAWPTHSSRERPRRPCRGSRSTSRRCTRPRAGRSSPRTGCARGWWRVRRSRMPATPRRRCSGTCLPTAGLTMSSRTSACAASSCRRSRHLCRSRDACPRRAPRRWASMLACRSRSGPPTQLPPPSGQA